jgi:hypothetical protein
MLPVNEVATSSEGFWKMFDTILLPNEKSLGYAGLEAGCRTLSTDVKEAPQSAATNWHDINSL